MAIFSLALLLVHGLLIYQTRSSSRLKRGGGGGVVVAATSQERIPLLLSRCVRASATSLLVITSIGTVQTSRWRPSWAEISRWFLLDAWIVTLGCWFIVPSLLALSLLTHRASRRPTPPPLPYGSPSSRRFREPKHSGGTQKTFSAIYRLPWPTISQTAVCAFAVSISTAVLAVAGIFLDIPASALGVSTMFKRISIFGNIIGASLYGVGTVNTPFDTLLRPPRKIAERELEEVLERKASLESDISDSPHWRETYEDLIQELESRYDMLVEQKNREKYREYMRVFGLLMLAIGLYRVLDMSWSLLYRITPGLGEDLPTDWLTFNIIKWLKLPLDADAIAKIISLIYVTILVGNSLNAFQKTIASWLSAWPLRLSSTILLPDLVETLLHCFYCASSLIIFRPAFHQASQELVVAFVGENLGRFHVHFNGVFVISTLITTIVRLL